MGGFCPPARTRAAPGSRGPGGERRRAQWSGGGATDARWDLDRHWRNARTHSVHDPVDWKHHHVGAYVPSGTPPPNHGQI